MSKKIGKLLLKILAGIMVLLLLAILLIRLPFIQTKIAHWAADKLSEQLNTKVAIDKVAVNFVDNASLRGIYIEDLENDTLLHARDISVDIAFFKLFKHIIEVDKISMNSGLINVKQKQDSVYNFQFILDALDTEEESTSPEESKFSIDLDKVRISDVESRAQILSGSHHMHFDDLIIHVKQFDLDQGKLGFEKIDLDGLQSTSIVLPAKDTSSNALESEIPITFPLSEIPFEIDIKSLSINKAKITIREDGFLPQENFDTRFMAVDDLQVKLKDISLNNEKMFGDIKELNFKLNEQFKLEEFSTGIKFSKEGLSLADLSIKTPESNMQGDIRVGYENFDALLNASEDLDIAVDIPSMNISMNNLSYFLTSEMLDPFKNEVLTMTLEAQGRLKQMNLAKLFINIGNTEITAKGKIANLLAPNNLELQDFILDAKADYEEYTVFLPDDTIKTQLKEFGDINITANASGSLDSMTINSLIIHTESLAETNLSGSITNLLDTEKLAYDLAFNDLTSGMQDVNIFLDSLPEILEKFDTIKYVGKMNGNIYHTKLEGQFISGLGNIKTDIDLKFNKDYNDAKYFGEITLEDFNLRELLDNDSLSTISMTAKVDGNGIDPDSIHTRINGKILKVGYNNYLYENINIEGRVDGRKFSGLADINDPNIRFDFMGSIDLSDSIPEMEFELALDSVNLENLNLSDEPLQVSLDIDADLKGLDPDEADGDLKIRNIALKNTDKEWQTDEIYLIARKEGELHGLSVESDFISADIFGTYELTSLPEVALDFLDQYFPLRSFLGSEKEDGKETTLERKRLHSKDVVEAKVEIFNVVELSDFFDIPISRFDTAKLDFKMDIPQNLAKLNFNIPTVIYDGYFIENIDAVANNNPRSIDSKISIDSISVTESIHLAGVNMDVVLKDQSAVFKGLVQNQKNEKSLGFTTLINSENAGQFSIDMIDDFILNNQEWYLNQSSSILAGSDGLLIPNIAIDNGDEAFTLFGNSDLITLDFSDFNLNNLVEIVGIDSLDISGLMNGNLEIGFNDKAPIDGDLKIKKIRFNEFNIGDLDLLAEKDGQDIKAELVLLGEEVNMEGDINYDLSSSYAFGKVLIEQLNLAPFNPFVTEYADDLKGAMQGYLAIEGELSDPLITGALYFQDVEALILPLATSYKIKEGRLNVTDGLIEPTAILEDEAGRLSYLDGSITHKYFSNVVLDLDFEAEEFQFLNSKQSKREYYYGQFVGKVSADMTGSLDFPLIEAEIEALEGTDLGIQLISSEAVLTQEDYMIFYDGSEIDSDEAIDSISRKVYEPSSAIALDITLNTTDEALFHVIVDPVTGDRLDIRGNSNLLISVPAQGDISLIGDYTVTEGNYRVSYENAIRRTFALDAGSKIVFQGDPSMAVLDMRALYSANVNTYPLLEFMGSSIDESSSQRSPINVVLNVDGTLSQPILSFDIVLSESSDDPVGNAVTSALSQLREDETLLLEQVGSVILFNSFIGGSNGGNISNVGTSTAINSVGNLINGQLNKLASRTKGFEIDFNIDQYKDATKEGNANVTEFGIGLQQKLLNDRLIISAGGNANLETGDQSSNNFSSFAGDFVIQYVLSDDGKLRVKVFQKSDFNALSNDNIWKTGAGFTYKTKFGQIKPKE